MAVCISAVIVIPVVQCSRFDRAVSPWRNSCAPPPELARVMWLAASAAPNGGSPRAFSLTSLVAQRDAG